MPRGTLTVVLVNAKLNDESTDLLKGSDPLVILTCGNQKQKSTAASGQDKTPVWNETFTFNISRGTSELNAKIVDKDDYSVDDVLGKATVPLEPVFVEGNILPTAYNVVKDDEVRGQIWFSLSFKSSGWNNSEASY